MLRRIIFKNNTTGQEVILPQTPFYDIERGVPVKTVELFQFGEVSLPGSGMTLFTLPLEFILPRQPHPWVVPGAKLDPYYYIEFFQLAADRKQTCRFVVSDTPTICDVLIENLKYGEYDGTNDVKCTLTVHRYRVPGYVQPTAETAGVAALLTRAVDPPTATQQSYTVKPGDTLALIGKRFYGSAGLAAGLAAYNGVKVAALLYPGQTLRLPHHDQL